METITLTKEQLKKFIEEAYQRGLEDAGKILIETVAKRKSVSLPTYEVTK